jgi:hypothetical protein
MVGNWTKIMVCAAAVSAVSVSAAPLKQTPKAEAKPAAPVLEKALDIAAGAKAICGGDKDQIYAVTDRELVKYNFKGEAVKKWKLPDGINGVQGVAVDAASVVYVGGNTSDGLGIVKLEIKGDACTAAATWKLAEAASITGMKANKDNVVVADARKAAIHVVDAKTGKFVRTIGGGRTGVFAVCCGILDVALDGKGNIVVGNLGQHRVTTMPLGGRGGTNWGTPGDKPVNFCGCCNPVSVTLLPNGGYATTEKSIPRVKVYTANHTVVALAPLEGFPSECGRAQVVADGEGNVYVLNPGNGSIRAFKAPKK